MIVADASVVVTALTDDNLHGRRARRRLAGEELVAPELLDLEVLSALRRMSAAGEIDDRRAEMAVSDLRVLRVRRVRHERLLGRCWELRRNATVYDSAYIALAELLAASLLTADKRLLSVPGARCKVELLS